VAATEGGTTAAAAPPSGEQPTPTDARPPRKPWRGRQRWQAREGENKDERPRESRPREDRPREDRPRGDGPRGGGPGQRDRRDDRRDKRPGGRGKRPFGRGRDREEHGRKPEQKLYASEAMVDHGFVDVPPAEEGGETKRVDWTITKRTVADQRSTKTISTVYVLKREGTETEFPFLAAAREAVNKKIVHPEKLTQPKESYAALYTKK
jgi:hypothetical protein